MIGNENISYFANGRTALKFGCISLNIPAGSAILVPDFICSVVWDPLIQLGFRIISYPIRDDMTPEWGTLEALHVRFNSSALMMVHYFGQPQDVEIFERFCKIRGIWLIEDVAHGHSGMHLGKYLGTFGDIGISSPRKFLNEPYGGCLHIKLPASYSEITLNASLSLPPTSFSDFIKIRLRKYLLLNSFLKGIRGVNRDWGNPYLFQEKEKPDWRISDATVKNILKAPWIEIGDSRRETWCFWEKFSIKNQLKPVFSSVAPESTPWAFPVYAKDIAERNSYLKWGAKNGIPIFTWPALPSATIDLSGTALSRWERLICFPLDLSPENYMKRIYFGR